MGLIKLLLVVIASSVLANQYLSERHILYHRSDVPENSQWLIWKQAKEDQVVTFSIALKQRNLDLLEELFWANSDPRSESFGKHLTREEILKLVAPSEEVQTSVMDWIEDVAHQQGTQVVIKNFKDMIQVSATVRLINELFQTTVYSFINTKSHVMLFKHMGSFSIPSKLSQHIEVNLEPLDPHQQMVTGITELPPSSSLSNTIPSSSTFMDGGNECNVPYTIKKLYGVPNDLVGDYSVNSSIYSEWSQDLDGEGFSIVDLTAFEQSNGLPDNQVTCVLGNAAQYYIPNGTDIEAIMDVQILEGIASGAKICFYVMNKNNGWMYEFTNEIFHTPDAPLVVSISYSWLESTQCRNKSDPNSAVGTGNCTNLNIPDSKTYVERTNVEFMKLGLAGFSVLVSSGDDGVAGGHISPDHCTTQEPLFPASSPYVTTVGATSVEPAVSPSTAWNIDDPLPPICSDEKRECVCSTSTNEQPATKHNTAGFASGGGFSRWNPMPDYQKKAVEGYINSGVHLPDQQLWNATNRAYPDVAAIGENFCVLILPNEKCNLFGGTSASTPLWAGLVTLLNFDRIQAGKSPLGFMNQILYDMYAKSPSQYFNNQFGEANNSGECDSSIGFNSISGFWTPLTGLGSPKFDQIRQYIASLP